LKIRRKPPKPSRSKPPLYIIGFSTCPEPAELRTWFDLEYGGLISFTDRAIGDDLDSPTLAAAHGPWSAWIQLSLPFAQAESWQHRLSWQHSVCGAVGSTTATRSQLVDVVLHATRLARGLTLLSGGTAYDVTTGTYLNPSDWTDRPLTQFHVKDHMTVVHDEDDERHMDWFYTRGLSKFGIDDIEVFRPKGLPSHTMRDDLIDIADELVGGGQSPNVGSTIPISALDLSIRVVRHRTKLFAERPLILREISW
jgi:hypothetical protein